MISILIRAINLFTDRVKMINKVSNINLNFKSYRQKFSDEEFQSSIQEASNWAIENVDNLKYLKTKTQMKKKIENEAQRGIDLLKKYKSKFKDSEFQSHVELSLEEKQLVGKVTYPNSTPVEIKTQLPLNIKHFFSKIMKTSKYQLVEDELNQQFWKIKEEEKFLEAQKRKRYNELTQNEKANINPLILAFDAIITSLNEKLYKIVMEKNEVIEKLDNIRPKLKNYQYKLKLKKEGLLV